MNNDDLSVIVDKIQKGPYAKEFIRVYGARIFDRPAKAYGKVGDAIQAFERTARFAPFNSRYDRYLEGQAVLTPQENRGREVFEREDKGNCAACHPNKPSPDGKQRPLFTDFSYDNIGVPRNVENRFYALPSPLNPEGWSFIDKGLGATVQDESQDGKFKVPTLRNIEKTGPYMHNGYFKTLRAVIEFYNTRDLLPECANAWATEQEARKMKCWPQAEMERNMNHDELGHLGLSPGEIDDLLAFLHTLNDD
jgi:cytochrome c peroxidase